jgi:hypothetical protein
MVTGVTAANVARATRGAWPQGCEGAGLRRRRLRHEPEDRRFDDGEDQQHDEHELPGAGANLTSAPAPRVPAESPAKTVKLLRTGARSSSVSRITAAKVVSQAGAESLYGTRDNQRGRRAGRYEEDHRQNVQRQIGQDRGAAPDVVRQRSHRE